MTLLTGFLEPDEDHERCTLEMHVVNFALSVAALAEVPSLFAALPPLIFSTIIQLKSLTELSL